jgi:DNA-binding transcriptional ArsR family regulator
MKPEFAKSLPEGWDRFSRFFFALGERTRQQILLVFDTGEEICVSDIARLFHLSRPAISHHLKVLREAGLLLSEKRGKEVYYRVNYQHCADVMRVVHEFIVDSSGKGATRTPRVPSTVGGVASWDRVEGSVPAATTRMPKSDD